MIKKIRKFFNTVFYPYGISNRGKNILYCLRKSFRSLIIWFPTIWCDRNWGDWFIYKILKKKLEDTRVALEKSPLGQDIMKNRIKNITICINLLSRLMDEDRKDREQRKRDLDYLFNIMRKDIENWSD